MDQVSPEQLSSQLKGIHAEVEKRVESAPEENRDEALHREVIHQVVGEKLGRDTGVAQPSPSRPVLPDEHRTKVEALLDKALNKNLDGAVDDARKESDAAVVDAFHDALVDKLYDELVSEGKLKKI